jgi:hypothetical protein
MSTMTLVSPAWLSEGATEFVTVAILADPCLILTAHKKFQRAIQRHFTHLSGFVP